MYSIIYFSSLLLINTSITFNVLLLKKKKLEGHFSQVKSFLCEEFEKDKCLKKLGENILQSRDDQC